MSAPTSRRVYAAPRTTDFVFSPVRQRSRTKTCELVPLIHPCISMGMQITNPSHTLIADEAALLAWVRQAVPGEQVAYWRGFLARDTWGTRHGTSEKERNRLRAVARRAWLMSASGQVHLVQRRVAPGVFEYIAIARPTKRTERRLLAPSVPVMEAA